ncbi:DUF1508 domain-containing protein [Pseudomonas bijieensis]|uniref:DUF1508 domain-containing protein n=1 Tax=Pseudomonas bijieensis TaxID=2681983 RepID=A0A6N1CBT0_9PSED|nr:DUF1508 domain-containing protein [Pseudomonas bijieensis]
MYFEIYRQTRGTPSTGKGQWRWRLRAGNHETIASGESYVNKSDCLHVIRLIKNVQGEAPVKRDLNCAVWDWPTSCSTNGQLAGST